jgi:hypothetical protein
MRLSLSPSALAALLLVHCAPLAEAHRFLRSPSSRKLLGSNEEEGEWYPPPPPDYNVTRDYRYGRRLRDGNEPPPPDYNVTRGYRYGRRLKEESLPVK